MWMKSRVAFLLALIATTWLSAAPEPDQAASFQERYSRLVQKYQTADAAFQKALNDAKSQQEAMKLLESNPRVEFAKRFLQLAEQNLNEPAAIDSLIWIIEKGGEDSTEIRKALRFLTDHYAASEKVEPLTLRMSNYPFPEREPFLRAVLEKSPNRNIQGKACLGLGRLLKAKAVGIRIWHERAKKNETLSEALGNRLGHAYVKKLLSSDPDKIDAEAVQFFDRAISQYGKVALGDRSVGAAATAELFDMRQLAVGQPAPEIEGEDVDGQEFKLSDYRGKVVLLDFWGHW